MNGAPLVAALGDSLTAGHVSAGGWPRYAPYTEVLIGEMTGSRVHNAGIDGDLCSGMLQRLERDVLCHQPALTIVIGGANDLGWGLAVPRIVETLTLIYDRLRAAGSDVVACSIPPLIGHSEGMTQREALSAALSEVAERRDLGFCDLFTPFIRAEQLDPRWSSDGLHLNEAGYDKMGHLLLPVVQRRLGQ